MQSMMMFFQYIVRILITIDFKYSWKHFQSIVGSLHHFCFYDCRSFNSDKDGFFEGSFYWGRSQFDSDPFIFQEKSI